MQIRVRDRGALTEYERGSAVSGNLREQTGIQDQGERRVLGHVRGLGDGAVHEFGRTARGMGREIDQLGDADVDDLAGRLGSRQAFQAARGKTSGRAAVAARAPIPTRVAAGVAARGSRAGARVAARKWQERGQRKTPAGAIDFMDRVRKGGRGGVDDPRAGAGRRRWDAVGDARMVASRVHSEVAAGGQMDVDRAAAGLGRGAARRAGAVRGRAAGKTAWAGARVAGRAGASAARSGASVAAQVVNTAARAAATAAQSAVAKIAAAAGSSILPGAMVVLAFVLLLVTILPSWMTSGEQAQREAALASVCVSSPNNLGPAKPHVEQATVFLGTKYGVETIGGWRPGNTYDVTGHPAGLAVDFMFPMNAEASSAARRPRSSSVRTRPRSGQSTSSGSNRLGASNAAARVGGRWKIGGRRRPTNSTTSTCRSTRHQARVTWRR